MKLIIIGHIAYNKDITPLGTKVSIGGSAYYASVGSFLSQAKKVNVIASVGNDFDLNHLSRININLLGIKVLKELDTALFTINQNKNNERTFNAKWGASQDLNIDIDLTFFKGVTHVHLATMPPSQQIQWIDFIRTIDKDIFISVDTFEAFAKIDKALSILTVDKSDFFFSNEAEYSLLDLNVNYIAKKHILKLGKNGAIYRDGKNEIKVSPPKVNAIETTGAGEILAGSFLTYVCNNEPPEKALKKAVNYASLSVEKFGVEHLLKII